jgi:glycosidase
MKKLVWIGFCLLGAMNLGAQIITTIPALPTANQGVTIYYDATKGNQGLKDYTGDVYAHTGVITTESTSGGDWKHVIAPWDQNIAKAKMTRLTTNLYSLSITPSIKDFYGVSGSETVLKMAFVFRSADRTRAGRTETGGDIFVDVYEEGLNVSITSPEYLSIANPGDNVTVAASCSQTATLSLYLNGDLVKSESGTSIVNIFQLTDPGDYWIRVSAVSGILSDADSVFIHVLGTQVEEPLPSGLRDGINYIDNDSAVLVLYAPGKQHVFVIGDFNQWLPQAASRMNKDGARFWLPVSNLTPGTEYAFQYLVDGTLRIADPYADKVLDPWNDTYITSATYPNLKAYPGDYTTGIVSILQTNQVPYTWVHPSFAAPEQKKLFIYELLLRDFIAKHDWKTLKDSVGYFARLGVNAIELMPINEFEGNLSWGYNPDFYFAPDKYYGPKNDLKAFIDSCHGKNVAVILDMVLNHSNGKSPLVQLYFDPSVGTDGQPTAENPWFNQVSPNPIYYWGYDFNHESAATKAFVDSVTTYWLTQYRVDGFRFDFSAGFTNTPGDGWNYDASRIAILERMANHIWKVNPGAYVILEHFTDNSEQQVLASYGMMLWGNMNHDYGEAAMGYSSDLTWGTAAGRGWDKLNLITYSESHDEERQMYRTLNYGSSFGSYDTKEFYTALRRMELIATFLLSIPGPKMIYEFGELGYDVNIDYNGRTGEKPIHWDYLSVPARYRLMQVYQCMGKLRKEQETFSTSNYTYSLSGLQKRITLSFATMNATLIGNFNVQEGSIAPLFQNTGKWYEYFSGDSIEVTDVNMMVTLDPGAYRLYTSKKLKTPQFVLGINDPSALPDKGMLFVYPNPSAGNFNFVVTSGHAQIIQLSIMDIFGKMIRNLATEEMVRGTEIFEWDGRTGSGSLAPAGLYFVRLITPGYQQTIKILKY